MDIKVLQKKIATPLRGVLSAKGKRAKGQRAI